MLRIIRSESFRDFVEHHRWMVRLGQDLKLVSFAFRLLHEPLDRRLSGQQQNVAAGKTLFERDCKFYSIHLRKHDVKDAELR